MKELIEKYVGKKATINCFGLQVEVEIKDVKVAYGQERYKVTPISGKGEVWVEKVSLIK